MSNPYISIHMRARIFLLLLLPTFAFAQKSSDWVFEGKLGLGRPYVISSLIDTRQFNSQQQFSVYSQFAVTKRFFLHGNSYIRAGLGLHQIAQRTQINMIVSNLQSWQPNPDPNATPELVSINFTGIMGSIPITLGTTRTWGRQQIYGEVGAAANVLLFRMVNVEDAMGEPVDIVSNRSFASEFRLQPTLSMAGGIEKALSSGGAFRIGIYAEPMFNPSDITNIIDGLNFFWIGLESGIQVSWVLGRNEK